MSKFGLGSLIALIVVITTFGAYASAPPADDFALTCNKYFSHWDLDKDGYLTEDELNQGIIDPSIKGKEAAALSAIKVYYRSKWKRDDSDHSVSLSDLCSEDPEVEDSSKELRRLFGLYQKKIANESPQLFSGGSPHIQEIKQGKTGDCYFLSTVGGMAYHTPDRLIRMISVNNDGSFSVTFPRHKAIAVPPPTDCELACYSDAGDDGLWLHVLEKAYAIFKNRRKGDEAIEPLDVVIHGGSGKRMVMFMTGHCCIRYPTKSTSIEELRTHLRTALSNHRIVNTGTSGHCLTILEYDPDSDQVTVWNPWGTNGIYSTVNQQMDHGIFKMPLSDLMRYFVSILPEQDYDWVPADFRK